LKVTANNIPTWKVPLQFSSGAVSFNFIDELKSDRLVQQHHPVLSQLQHSVYFQAPELARGTRTLQRMKQNYSYDHYPYKLVLLLGANDSTTD
jgi:hypothetical protein